MDFVLIDLLVAEGPFPDHVVSEFEDRGTTKPLTAVNLQMPEATLAQARLMIRRPSQDGLKSGLDWMMGPMLEDLSMKSTTPLGIWERLAGAMTVPAQ